MTTPFTTLYVTHDLDVPIHDLSLAVDRLPARTRHDGVALTVDRVDTRRPRSASDPWRSLPATLRVGRRPAFRVSLEAVPWSHTRSQIGIRPDGRACSLWSQRFCDAAATVAASLSRGLTDSVASAELVSPPGEVVWQVQDLEFDDGESFTLLKVVGDLDAGSGDQLRDEVVRPIDAGASRVVVDLAGLRSVDDAGIATLAIMTLVADGDAPDDAVTLTGIPTPVRRSLATSEYAHLLAVA